MNEMPLKMHSGWYVFGVERLVLEEEATKVESMIARTELPQAETDSGSPASHNAPR